MAHAGRWGTAAAILLLAGGVLLAALVAMRQPLWGGDYAAIWGLKARAIARSGTIGAVFRVDPDGEFSHPEYPPFWSLLLAVASLPAGRYDDLAVTPIWPLLCLSAGLSAVRLTRAAPPFRWLSGACVALLPYWRTYPGYAEGLLVVLLLAAASEAERLETEPFAAWRLATLLTLAAWTKQEGVWAALVFVLLLFGARRPRVAWLILLSVLLFAVAPWGLAVALSPVTPRRDFALAAFSLPNLSAAAHVLAGRVLPNAAWAAGGTALLALAPGTRRRRRALLAGALLYAAGLLLAFSFAHDPAWLMRWSWDRLLFVPLALLAPLLVEAAGEGLAAAEPVA